MHRSHSYSDCDVVESFEWKKNGICNVEWKNTNHDFRLASWSWGRKNVASACPAKKGSRLICGQPRQFRSIYSVWCTISDLLCLPINEIRQPLHFEKDSKLNQLLKNTNLVNFFGSQDISSCLTINHTSNKEYEIPRKVHWIPRRFWFEGVSLWTLRVREQLFSDNAKKFEKFLLWLARQWWKLPWGC